MHPASCATVHCVFVLTEIFPEMPSKNDIFFGVVTCQCAMQQCAFDQGLSLITCVENRELGRFAPDTPPETRDFRQPLCFKTDPGSREKV